ncbi:RNA polymerase subunit sigma-70 [Sphingomonas oleivorans]|uniref:RNA polymerase subunit sigma-70 n=1 Tax=Sphingomonas oleivorans TaxID=1735121 RepID=A0A2T5G075_9SPHN|nr:RNA polymerase sigma factor [Sphingomonas oleivorans]PTQ12359.1 RNA polymerase subunit sigma-70 [Sphingomonas oleivorans]
MDEFEGGLTALLPRLRRFAHGLSRSSADADDLTQTAVERALKARSQWEPGTRLDSWLFRIARNAWIDTVRGRGRADRVLAPEEAGEAVGMDGRPAIEAKAEMHFLMRALDRLPDEQREVIALVMIDGMAYREAAELLDLPMGTLTSRLVRGRQALLKIMGEACDD